MDDTTECPICNNKLRTNTTSYMKHIEHGPAKPYISRTCTLGLNHTLQIFSFNSKISLLKMSLDIEYSKFIEVNFVSNTCQILLLKNHSMKHIDIPKILDLDFPNLDSLRNKVDMFISFS